MKYSDNSHISSIEAVKDFFDFIVKERQVNFHPDEPFDQYVNLTTRRPTFTPDECALYDHLMNEAFEVCNKVSEDLIYELAEEAHHE